MTRKEQFEALLKIGYEMSEAIEMVNNLNNTDENSPYLNENKENVSEPTQEENTLKTASRASENVLAEKLMEMQNELKALRTIVHEQNRKNAVLETEPQKVKTLDENVEELIKSLEV